MGKAGTLAALISKLRKMVFRIRAEQHNWKIYLAKMRADCGKLIAKAQTIGSLPAQILHLERRIAFYNTRWELIDSTYGTTSQPMSYSALAAGVIRAEKVIGPETSWSFARRVLSVVESEMKDLEADVRSEEEDLIDSLEYTSERLASFYRDMKQAKADIRRRVRSGRWSEKKAENVDRATVERYEANLIYLQESMAGMGMEMPRQRTLNEFGFWRPCDELCDELCGQGGWDARGTESRISVIKTQTVITDFLQPAKEDGTRQRKKQRLI